MNLYNERSFLPCSLVGLQPGGLTWQPSERLPQTFTLNKKRTKFIRTKNERKLFGQKWSLSSCFFSDSFFAVTLLLSNRWCHLTAEAWRRLEVVATHSQCLFVYDEFWFGDQRYFFLTKWRTVSQLAMGRVSQRILFNNLKKEKRKMMMFLMNHMVIKGLPMQ